MSYKNYFDQVREHIMFLQSEGFDINILEVNTGFIRCNQIDKVQYRGELAYKTRTVKLNNGLTGLQTWYRGLQGKTSSFQTYGLGPEEGEVIECKITSIEARQEEEIKKYDVASRKAFGFWQHSLVKGRSEYLERKRVGAYGIRFRTSPEYGDVAVVPMVDFSGRLWSYQLLNPDGSKRQPKDARTEGLSHMIGSPCDGKPIGIAESYVTSASCFELTGIPTACAFGCQNLKSIARILRHQYPNSQLIMFADNDKHLEMRGVNNQGIKKSQEAIEAIKGNGILIIPEFDSSVSSKKLSDWNDLVNYKGVEYARSQIQKQLEAHRQMREQNEKARPEEK